MFKEEFQVTGLTRFVAFASLITVVAAVSVGGADSALEPVATVSQVTNVAA